MLIDDPFVRRHVRMHNIHVEDRERPIVRIVSGAAGCTALAAAVTGPDPGVAAANCRGRTGGTQVGAGRCRKDLAVGIANTICTTDISCHV